MRSVLHVTATNAGRGAERFASDLCGALAARGLPGELVAVAPGHPPELDIPAVGARWPSFAPIRRIRCRVRASDVVVAHGSSSLPACAVASLGTGTPFVYRNIGDPTAWARTRAARLRVGIALRRARAVAALSDQAREALVVRYGLDPGRVVVLPTGVDELRFRVPVASEIAAARTALGIEGDGAHLAVIGALEAEKDVGLAIDAVALLPGASLLVAGTGSQLSRLERHAAAVAPGQVRFLGAIGDVAGLLAAVDAVVLTSRTEGLPAVLIEAAMVGRPVAAVRAGGVAGVVDDGVTGVLAEGRDASAVATAVRAALALSISPDRIRAHAVSRFGLSLVADRWAQLLEHVVAGEVIDVR